ncbi:MAG: L-glutamine:2-deoxy-scyllo-inosose aminotransferase [Planctomycetes bacterium RBG_13_62_9]|nr:MAG: L-glutamine:2-deoxy-scyllo-inosose aminotransferase [Planctomycetes bacterium RBG_13_62_9]
MMSQLALKGGKPVRNARKNPWPKWPACDQRDEKALLDVLRSGVWSYNGPKEKQFNAAFAKFTGTKYALAIANGTVTLQLALEACGIGYGDEVIVPGLTWQATAASALDINAIPVLVDVTEDTWCIDPAQVEAAITPRTKAIIPVHLYGSFADMDAIMAIARRHGLKVIEDCAHKHGGAWKGRKAGSIGDIGSFSFQLSKLMTAGEGGALTTSDPGLYEKLDALRNCGRRPEPDAADKGAGIYGDEGNFIQSGNYRLTDFQAALLFEALRRLPGHNKVRDKNAIYLNSQLAQLPGVLPMRRDKRETAEAYYNFSFRYKQDEFKGLPVARFREALAAELGCAVEASYKPLNACSLYAPLTKPWRYKLTTRHWKQIDPRRFKLPVCDRIHDKESVCFHHRVLMGPKADMDLIVEAIRKVYDNGADLM